MRYYAAMLGAVLALTTPVQAGEACDEACKVKCKTVVIKTGDDENLVTLSEGDDGKLVTICEDGKNKVIRLKGGKLLDVDDKLDTDAHLSLLDAKIAYIKATGSLKTDLAVKRAEAEKLELAKKPESDVTAKKKEINALKARLADARLDYEQAVKKLVPEDLADLYMLGLGDDTDMLSLSLGLPAGVGKKIIKRIELRDDGEDND
ncbi:hypothetical protein FJY68_02935 [candidate division WOR-3 bacterium]|uniref:Uncharacterized protein n=1 Tax=candidate division WOR-3 bacterium TaxID=2052148 RepID=A0A938BSP8_UNCW3|nr:hypothetical protein [candidate division WOR-3 bacterium]